MQDAKPPKHWSRSLQIIDEEVGTGRVEHHGNMASQNRQPNTSSNAVHYIDHLPKLAPSHSDHGTSDVSWSCEEVRHDTQAG